MTSKIRTAAMFVTVQALFHTEFLGMFMMYLDTKVHRLSLLNWFISYRHKTQLHVFLRGALFHILKKLTLEFFSRKLIRPTTTLLGSTLNVAGVAPNSRTHIPISPY
jgi:hypothetical protein